MPDILKGKIDERRILMKITLLFIGILASIMGASYCFGGTAKIIDVGAGIAVITPWYGVGGGICFICLIILFVVLMANECMENEKKEKEKHDETTKH